MIEKIIKILEEKEYEYYGVRVDDYVYEVNNVCNHSHQLYQDPMYDEHGGLVYEYNEELGEYDAGELDGTCAIKVTTDNIDKALEILNMYVGDHIYLIASDIAEAGNDENEIIIKDAKVLLALK